jgi:pimeloyl-ACP methyl ester carboxylesterase
MATRRRRRPRHGLRGERCRDRAIDVGSDLGEKILVGHSYGGFVITNAASGRNDIRGLVYTAAYFPDTDETINSMEVGYTPGTFLSYLVLAPAGFRSSSTTRSSSPRTSQDLNPKLAAQITAEQPRRACHLRHSIVARLLARHTVVVRDLRGRSRDRPEPATVHGRTRRIDDGPIRRGEPRGRPHALPRPVRQVDRGGRRSSGVTDGDPFDVLVRRCLLLAATSRESRDQATYMCIRTIDESAKERICTRSHT